MGPISSDPAFVEQLWALAQRERDRLVHIVESVGQSVAAPTYELTDEIDVAEVLQKGCEAATSLLAGRIVVVKPAADLPRLKASARAVTRLAQILVTYAARLSRADGTLSIAAIPAQITAAPGVTILVNGAGANWSESDVASCFTPFAFPENDPSDLGLDLMTAFSIAYHHGGDIVVHASGPAGPALNCAFPPIPPTSGVRNCRMGSCRNWLPACRRLLPAGKQPDQPVPDLQFAICD